MLKIARAISIILVPPAFTLAVYIYFALFLETEPIKEYTTILIPAIFGFVSPILLFISLRRRGKLSDNDALIKEERTFPFLISTLFFIAGFLLFIYAEVNIISIALWFCYISNTILIVMINKFWKISAHLMSAAGHAAALLAAHSIGFWIILLLLPLLGWSRYKLRCHDPLQLTGGVLIGFFSTYIQMLIIINYFNA